jgi:predicted  nucleic acid-binding Zn-ribbon protein
MAAKGTTLKENGEMLNHVVKHMATKDELTDLKDELTDLKTEMMDQFEHVEEQFRAVDERLRGITSELAVIHRRIERLEELGASNTGFAKEIDFLLARVTAIEEHLGIKKAAA